MKLRIWIDPQDGSHNIMDDEDNWICQTSRPSGYRDGLEEVRAKEILRALSIMNAMDVEHAEALVWKTATDEA